MCDTSASSLQRARSAPRPAPPPAADPVSLNPVDAVRVTTLVDNTFDTLLVSQDGVRRPRRGIGTVSAPLFEGGHTAAGLRAEHGFSALVQVDRGGRRTSVLFDTGVSPDGMATNAERLGVDLGDVHAVVLSHGHYDHAGGFSGLLRLLGGRRGLPLTVHPHVWTRRRTVLDGADPIELPTLSARALRHEGIEVIERRQPSLLIDDSILVTGEVDRTTAFEQGMPASHQAWDGHGWRHDAAVIDDQAIVVSVRGRGLVVLTGCGHAGVVNIARYAMHLTGTDRLCALLGGFHLSGPAFEGVIEPTVATLTAMVPDLVVPGHCTGWRAQHALAASLPEAWVQSSVGTTYELLAA